MGQFYSSQQLSQEKEIKIYMHGLWNVGKKSILEKLELQTKEMPRTVSANVISASYKNISIISWDIGGRCYSRSVARRFYEKGVDALLIVVDSTDQYCGLSYGMLLTDLLQDELLKDTIFLFLANKQDHPSASSVNDVAYRIGFGRVKMSHVTNIMGCSAESGEGLQEAMDWLAGELEKKKEMKKEEETEKEQMKPLSVTNYLKGGLAAVNTMLPKAA